MPTTAPDSPPDDRLHVAVGVLRRDDGKLLVQQRIANQVCAGQWEFPGGKVEVGESACQALVRELREELGMTFDGNAQPQPQPLLTLPFDYPHARVWLEVFLVEPGMDNAHRGGKGCEGQPTRWLLAHDIRRLDVLPPVHPILDAMDAIQKLSK